MWKLVGVIAPGLVTLLLTACGSEFSEDAASFADDATTSSSFSDASLASDATIAMDDADGAEGSADARAGDGDAAGSTADAARDAGSGDGAVDAATAGPLGSASRFALLAATTIMVAGTPSSVTGDVGVGSPGGPIGPFPANQPVGTIYDGGAVADQAQTDVTTAYETIEAMGACSVTNTLPATLGDVTLPPGMYCAATTLTLTGTLTLDAQGKANATWIFRIGTTLTTAASSMLATTNSASGCNVTWAIGTTVTLGAGSFFEGNLLAKGAITLGAGASLLAGRALSRQDAVTLNGNDVSTMGCH